MAGKSIAQLKKEILDLERKNKELEERKKLEKKLSDLKESAKPKKISAHGRIERARRKVRSALGPIGDSFDRAFG